MESKTIMGVFIAFLMLGGMFGIFMSGEQGSRGFRYNDFAFKYDDNNVLFTEINDEEISFYYHPQNMNDSSIPSEFNEFMNITNKIYYTIDLNGTLNAEKSSLGFDLATNLFNTHEIYVHSGINNNQSPN
ncbi:hypothetical protein KY321_03925, partial [Candidatus Woesearchaeota archaeon]|nr:hypothetical protein [Candidatus Woesearchaeota archaeon]